MRMEWMKADFFYGFASQRRMNRDSFVLTFSVISTAFFPGCVMSTGGDISLINVSIRQCGNVSISEFVVKITSFLLEHG